MVLLNPRMPRLHLRERLLRIWVSRDQQRIEDAALAAAVGSDEDGQRRQVLEFAFADAAELRYFD